MRRTIRYSTGRNQSSSRITGAQFPLSIKARELLTRNSLTPLELIQELGYCNHNKGLRRWQSLLNGKPCPVFFRKLCKRFPEAKTTLLETLEETTTLLQQREIELRKKHFSRRLWALTEKEPYNFFSAIAAAALRDIKLASSFMSEAEIRQLIVEHYALRDGECAQFGRIVGYCYEPEYGKRLYFDVSGRQE